MRLVGNVGLLVLLGAGSATGAAAKTMLLTEDKGYTGPALDLGAFADGDLETVSDPVTLPGGMTLVVKPSGGGQSGEGALIGQGAYGLGVNGRFDAEATFIALDAERGHAELIFDEPVAAFGGYWNYSAPPSGRAPFISAFDESGKRIGRVLLSRDAPISTPGGTNEFVFRGLASDEANIHALRFGGSYLMLSGSEDGSLAPSPSPVPLPPALALMLAALGVLQAVRVKAA